MQRFRSMNKALRSAATSIWIILFVALAVRLGFMWQYQSSHPKQAVSVIPFLFESGNIAHSLATGHGFSSPFRVDTGPTAWMTPAFPLLLAGIFRLFGAYTFHAWEAIVLFNILCCTLACVPIFYAGKRIGEVGLAAGAAWLWAIFPNAILIPVESMWDASVSALLVATILWATLALAESDRMRDWCAYGLLWGATLMVNATLAALLPLLLGWRAYRQQLQKRSWFGRATATLAIVVLCSVPWTIRNHMVFHHFVPLRSVLGLQLWLGNNDRTQDIFRGDLHPIYNAGERREIHCDGRNCLHARETARGCAIHAVASRARSSADRLPVHFDLVGRHTVSAEGFCRDAVARFPLRSGVQLARGARRTLRHFRSSSQPQHVLVPCRSVPCRLSVGVLPYIVVAALPFAD